MSDTTQAPTAPTGTAAPAAPTAVTSPDTVPTPAPTATTSEDPPWFKPRMDRERKSWLKQLGVETDDDAKAAFAELKKRRESELSDQEKLRAQVAELQATAARAKTLESAIASRADAELAALTEAQRSAVTALAGDDPAARLNAITALRPTWAAPAPAAPAPIAAPATTSPASAAPAPTAPATDNVLATYEALVKRNPMQAAQYRLANLDAYLKATQARG